MTSLVDAVTVIGGTAEPRPGGVRSGAGRQRSGGAYYDQSQLRGVPPAAVTASTAIGNPFRAARPRIGQVVVDMGGGAGLDAIIASRLVGSSGHVYLIDDNALAISVARRNARHARCGNVTFLHADMTAPALLPPSSADWVISNHAMSFAVDKAAALRSARRVLTSNGTLVCTMLARNGTSGRQQCRHAPLPAGQVERSLADAGFHRAVTAECRVIGGDLVAITVVAHAGATPNSPAVNTKAEW